MSLTEQVLTVLMLVLGTQITRALPFLLFPPGRPTPPFVAYLGRYLPGAVFAMLVVYCLKDVDFAGPGHGLRELLGMAATIGLHLWRRQMMLSIAGGTIAYMLLVRL